MSSSKIFISYRRSDGATTAVSLERELKSKFGSGSTFLDVNNILSGNHFRQKIEEVLSDTSVMVVVISPQWLNPEWSGRGNRSEARLAQSPIDYVEFEICSAFEKGIPIFPVLVENAEVPDEKDLPASLENLISVHAARISTENWGHDVRLLIDTIKSVFPGKKSLRIKVLATVVLAVLVGVGLLSATAMLGSSGNSDQESANVTAEPREQPETSFGNNNKVDPPSLTDPTVLERPSTPATSTPTTFTVTPTTRSTEPESPTTQSTEPEPPTTQSTEPEPPTTQSTEPEPPTTQSTEPEPPEPQPGDPNAQMVAGIGGNCLDVPIRQFRSGQDLHMWPCDDNVAQQWVVSGDQLTIQGMCLDIEGPSLDEGANAQIWDCSDVPQQTWSFESSGAIVSKYSNLCLEVTFGDTSPGAGVSMGVCDGSAKQTWRIADF